MTWLCSMLGSNYITHLWLLRLDKDGLASSCCIFLAAWSSHHLAILKLAVEWREQLCCSMGNSGQPRGNPPARAQPIPLFDIE